ncbi:MAG: tetratricopeptide repeat protein [Nitrospira sp.]|nr:tetratricopeptide repeat protein [Nitrospira sp.]
MALLQLNCGDKVQEQNFRNALQAVPSSSLRRAEVLVLYSQCLFRTRQRESDAVPLLKEAVRILPSNAGVQRHLGYAYFRLGRDLEAIEAIERSLDLEPNAYTYGQLGFVLMRSVSGPLTGDRARKQRANVL